MSQKLDIARNHYKRKNWESAAQCYSVCYDDIVNEFSEDDYVKYAKVLKRIGKTSKAEEVLKVADKSYPGEIKIVNEQYSLYSSILNWNEAEKCALEILELDNNNPDGYFKLGRIYYFMEEKDKAKDAYLQGLEETHGETMNNLIVNIQKAISENYCEIKTTYEFISGENNLGSFTHTYKDKQFFTKITKTSSTKKYEIPFYKNIRNSSQVFDNMTPKLIHVKTIDGICYLTTEKRNIEETSIGDIENVIKVANMISVIPYSKVDKVIKNRKYNMVLEKKVFRVMRFLTKIHDEKNSELLLESFNKFLIENNYPYCVKEIFDRARIIISENKLYRFIDPVSDYTFIHGDFKPENIQKDKENGDIVVIDWASATTGPRFLDILNYLSLTASSFREVKEFYLNSDISQNLTTLERIFFVYGYILMCIVYVEKQEIEAYTNSCLLPAINILEELSNKYMKYEYDNQVLLLEYKKENQKLSDERKNQDAKLEEQKRSISTLEKQIKELNKKHKTLNKKHATLNKKHINLLNSRSWKITVPLRKINNFIKR